MSMYSERDIIDISSDEEDELPCWIDELLDQIVNFVEIPKDNNSDDECMILDGDPDKAVVKDAKGGREDDSDELVVVGEKGQVACRDFPHSRHLCVSFPFNTTSHQKYCSLCHCYVCDSLAPCMYWGDGVSLSDHCHATDKVEMWKIQRKSLKGTANMAGNPFDATSKMPSPPVRNTAPLPFQVPVPLTNILRPCTASIVAPPYAPGRTHHRQAAVTSPRHHPQTAVTGPRHRQKSALAISSHHHQKSAISSHGQRHTTRSQSPVPGTPGVQRGRHGTDALACLMVQTHRNFKRVENTGTVLRGPISSGINRSQYMASNQNLRSLPHKSPWLPEASQRRQQRAVTPQQRPHSSHLPPISTAISQNLPTSSIASHTPIKPVTFEDSTRNSCGSFAGVGSELGVSDNNDKDMATFQPCIVSSLPPSVDGQAPSQIDSNQGMMSYSDLGSNETISHALDFDDIWLDGSEGGNFSSGHAQFEVSYDL